ncbi:DUF4426 domain-containing protein [Shewanella surugensis]|uniref:DUF4426 domain-containing protein n=1 Tax=Shewanella surugensis TaxID=212020 RepID=A0ABT0LFS6_9GAMM|nr:DUF4426 domain-containing protein [Shewanella surugensis]MCL1126539.1 DUF4426 domain-containing protein [Shewanella surugensis]
MLLSRLSNTFKSLFIVSLFFSPLVSAEQKLTVGNYDIHYIALDSTFLSPSIAKAYDLKRSRYIGIINISVLDNSDPKHTAVPVELSGVANNLLDKRRPLKFKEIKEGDAIYYIAEIPYRDDQEINFNINVKYGSKLNTQLKFKHKFYVD